MEFLFEILILNKGLLYENLMAILETWINTRWFFIILSSVSIY